MNDFFDNIISLSSDKSLYDEFSVMRGIVENLIRGADIAEFDNYSDHDILAAMQVVLALYEKRDLPESSIADHAEKEASAFVDLFLTLDEVPAAKNCLVMKEVLF